MEKTNPIEFIKKMGYETSWPATTKGWKPWMLKTKVFIPNDLSRMNWELYRKDCDDRLRICAMLNRILKTGDKSHTHNGRGNIKVPKEVVKEMLGAGNSIRKIHESTHCSVDTIRSIRDELKKS